jgi:hypothetical protein
MTSTVPAAIHAVNGSSSMTTPMRMVDRGPIMPVCAATAGPMRSMAIMTIRTGTAVHTVALSTESQMTSGASCIATLNGRVSTNCRMHSTHATVVASPTSRSDPRRLTNSPL